MAKRILNIFDKIKRGMFYKKKIAALVEKSQTVDDGLIAGAKIIYNAQSTFHTIE